MKLADRLHNMRTLSSMRPDKQMKIASETDYFYAPLANRLGLYNVKTELENLSFRYRCPREYEKIEKQLSELQLSEKPDVDAFIAKAKEILEANGIDTRIELRARCSQGAATSSMWTASTICVSSTRQTACRRRKSTVCTSMPCCLTASRSVLVLWSTISMPRRRTAIRVSM